MPELVWINGTLVPATEATVSVFDHGLTVGDGIFETLRAVDGEAFAIRRHLDRLRRSAAGLGLGVPYGDDELRRAMAAVVASYGLPLARVRLTVTGGSAPLGSDRGEGSPTVILACGPLAMPAPTTAVCTVPWVRNEHSAVAGLKTTSYAENVVALAYAKERGCTEAIFATTTGLLCEGTGSNVFVGIGGRLLTPPLSAGCLAGVTRELLLQVADVVEEDIPMDAFLAADEVFITSSGRDVQPVDRIDDRQLPAPGPLTIAAAGAFAELVATNIDP